MSPADEPPDDALPRTRGDSLPRTESEAPQPETLGHYRVEGEIGRGGMGIVYLAEDTRLGRRVALKVLPEAVANDSEALASFEREARIVAALDHPNIAMIYALERAGDVSFITLQLVPGETLAARLAPLADGDLCGEASQVCMI